jgi:hypothetical protein
MPPASGPSKKATASSTPLLRGRVTRGATIVNQCKVPDATPWIPPGFEFLFTAPLKPQQTPVPHPVLVYIVGEMKKNAESDAVKKIHELNESHAFKDALAEYKKQGVLWKILFGRDLLDSAMKQDISAKVAANVSWACKVADARTSAIGCGIWDHKPYIQKKWTVIQWIDFTPIGKAEQVDFYYDVWSNIHYGYVGRAAGFTEQELIDWAANENAISNPGVPEPISDRRAIEIGSRLYADGSLNVLELLKKLYASKGRLHHYNPNLPKEKRVYTDEK